MLCYVVTLLQLFVCCLFVAPISPIPLSNFRCRNLTYNMSVHICHAYVIIVLTSDVVIRI